jgi:hypothetical protein
MGGEENRELATANPIGDPPNTVESQTSLRIFEERRRALSNPAMLSLSLLDSPIISADKRTSP